jgi:hypothetical protein
MLLESSDRLVFSFYSTTSVACTQLTSHIRILRDIQMAAATAEQKESWPAPNYVHPVNLYGLIIGVTGPSIVLAVICKYPNFQITNPRPYSRSQSAN